MKVCVASTLVAALSALLAAGLTACSGTAAAPVSTANATIPLLREGLAFDVPSLDEAKSLAASQVTAMSLETLVKFGPQGQLEPDLASSWAQTSPVTYVYHLRHDVRFWDGNPLTSADVVYSLNHYRAAGSAAAFTYLTVKAITATDPYTVTVTLTRPDASWQFVPAEDFQSVIFEMKFALAHKLSLGQPGTLMMGSGPWKIDSYDPTSGAQLSANPHWWGGKVPIQRISFTFYSTETSEALAYRAGEIDMDPNIASAQSFASASGAKLQTVTGCSIGFFGMNVHSAGWDDVHVRRAVAYALNRPDIIAANGGYATLTPPQQLRTVASQAQVNTLLGSIPLYPYNLAQARAQMAASAYPHGFTTTIASDTGSSTVPEVTQVIAAELAKIGIRAQIKQMSDQAWTATETGPASQRLAAFSGGACFNPDPGTYSDWLGNQNAQVGGYNFADYTPSVVDTLLAQGGAAASPGQRFTAYAKLFQQLQTDEPYVGLFVSDTAIALTPKFTLANYNQWFGDTPYALDIKLAA
jgi:peptide/nickel transport system substrate-binding protein